MINLNLPFKVILKRFEVVSDVWSENAALFKRWMKSHSNPPILYYGFNERVMGLASATYCLSTLPKKLNFPSLLKLQL